MALSGKINGTVSNKGQYFKFFINWSATQSISGNYSDVTMRTYWQTTSTGWTFDTISAFPYYAEINGNRTSGKKRFDLNPWPSNPYLIQSKKTRVYHKSDGTKSINIKGYANGNAGSYGPSESYASSTITLNRIPRTSIPTLSSNKTTIDNDLTIYTNRKSSAFTHTISATFGSFSKVLAKKVATSYVWDTSLEDFYQYIPNSTTLNGTITLTTYSGSTLIGTSSVSATLEVISKDEIKPLVGNFTYTDNNSVVIEHTGGLALIKGLSNIVITPSTFTAQKYASFKEWELTHGSKKIYSNDVISDIDLGIINSLDIIYLTGYDSRNFDTTVSQSPLILNYIKPLVRSLTVERRNGIDAEVNMSLNGDYSLLDINNKVNSLLEVSYRSKVANGTYGIYTNITKEITQGDSKFNGNIYIGNTYDRDKDYYIEVKIADKFSTVFAEVFLSKGIPTIDIVKSGMAINKIYEKGALEVNGDIYMNDKLVAVVDEETEWQMPTFQNGFYNYEFNFDDVAFRRKGNRVELKGLLNCPGGSYTNYYRITMFTLPVEMRPHKTLIFAVVVYGVYSGTIYIYVDGRVQLASIDKKIPSLSRPWISLSQISYEL